MQIFYRKFGTSRKFGVELEIGNEIKKPIIRKLIKSKSEKAIQTSRYSPSINNSWWHVKDDATCGPAGRGGPKGIEVASFVASGVDDLRHICEVADFLKESGAKVNDNCGLHIHADASDISESQMGRILSSWIKIEGFLSLALPFRRRDNPYCERLSSKNSNKLTSLMEKHPSLEDNIAKALYQIVRPLDISMYENQDRRVTLNLVNYCRAIEQKHSNRKTIELRWPEGTLSGEDIKNWVRLFLNFIEHAKNAPLQRHEDFPSLQEGLNILGLGHQNGFCILSEGLLATKTWLLERMLKNPDLYKIRIFEGCPVINIFGPQDIVNYLNFLWQPVKNYSLEKDK